MSDAGRLWAGPPEQRCDGHQRQDRNGGAETKRPWLVGELDAVAAGLDRNNRWELSVAGGVLFLAAGGSQHESPVRRCAVTVRAR